jgi:hypothetical protein
MQRLERIVFILRIKHCQWQDSQAHQRHDDASPFTQTQLKSVLAQIFQGKFEFMQHALAFALALMLLSNLFHSIEID